MAGPTASVLFARAEPDPVLMVRQARLGCGHNSGEDEEFWIDGRPFLATNGPEYPEMLVEVAESGLPRLLGWTPRGVVTFSAMCNDVEDHRLLARLCLAFCEQTEGVVDFGGTLPFGPDLDGLVAVPPSRTANPAGLHGVLFATSYEIATGSFGTMHYGDANLLRAWLASPNFHMIK